MPWFILIVSAIFEAIWATALGQSDGFSKAVPNTIFAIALAISMLGLSHAAKSIPIGTAYAIWTGLGASLTVGWAMFTSTESASALKLVFITGIIAATLGLRFTKNE